MNIEDLFHKNKISVRSYNICCANNLLTLNDLQVYLSTHHTFIKLPNCGQLSDNELKKIASSASQQENLTLEESKTLTYLSEEYLISSELDKLSARSKNALLAILGDYPTLHSIKELGFFSSDAEQKIANIRNVGRKSIVEIKLFFHAIQQAMQFIEIDNSTGQPLQQTIQEIIYSLTWEQRKSVNDFINLLKSTLSVRSVNILTDYFGGDFRAKSIFSRDLSFRTIKALPNSGTKSVEEIQQFIKQITQVIKEIQSNPVHYVNLFKEVLIDNHSLLNKLPREQFIKDDGLKIVDTLIKKGGLFSNHVAIEYLPIYDTDKVIDTLENIGKRYDITRERVRQIHQKALKEIETNLTLLRPFYSRALIELILGGEDSVTVLSNALIQRVNRKFQTNFSGNFIIYLLSLSLPKNKQLLGNTKFLLSPRRQGAKHSCWEKFYLIDTVEDYDFYEMGESIYQRLSQQIEKNYRLNFENFIEKFSINNKVSSQTLAICEKLLAEEFNLFIDLNNEIVFHRNTRIKVHEYAYNILKKSGKPMKIETIYHEVKKRYPEYGNTVHNLRAAIQREDLFVPIGRASVWGLREWEYTKDHFAGGTMLDLTTKFLEQFEEPKHITEITDFVLQYRETNESKLLSNLKFNTRGKFVFFRGRYIGLTGKKYSENFILLAGSREQRTWKESYDSFLDFISTRNRLPQSSASSEAEQRLYRWFNIQERRYYDNKLSQEKNDKIQSILNKYK